MEESPRDDGAAPATQRSVLRPETPEKEHPSDIAAVEDDDAAALDPRRAYEVLEIRTPLEEFEAYVRARIETLTRLGDTKKAEVTSSALELGRRALARVTGA